MKIIGTGNYISAKKILVIREIKICVIFWGSLKFANNKWTWKKLHNLFKFSCCFFPSKIRKSFQTGSWILIIDHLLFLVIPRTQKTCIQNISTFKPFLSYSTFTYPFITCGCHFYQNVSNHIKISIGQCCIQRLLIVNKHKYCMT